MPITVRSELSDVIINQNQIITELRRLRATMIATSCCYQPTMPDIPYLPPIIDPISQTDPDSTLCRRIQRELDNYNDAWNTLVSAGISAGALSGGAIATLIASLLAPETGGLSLIAVAALGATLTGLILDFASDAFTRPDGAMVAAAQAAFAVRASGSGAATDAAKTALESSYSNAAIGAAYAAGFGLWGGLTRAFDTAADIGDWSSYPLVCSGDGIFMYGIAYTVTGGFTGSGYGTAYTLPGMEAIASMNSSVGMLYFDPSVWTLGSMNGWSFRIEVGTAHIAYRGGTPDGTEAISGTQDYVPADGVVDFPTGINHWLIDDDQYWEATLFPPA